MSQQVLALKNRISAHFLTIPDELVYGEVLSIVLKELKSKYGVFGYIDENGDFICPSMTRDVWEECNVPNKDIVYPRKSWSNGNTIWGRALISGENIYLNKPFKVPKGHISINRALAVPINYKDKVIGLILVGNKKTDYNDKDVKLIESITEYISPILSARLQRDLEEKRRKQAEDKLKETERKVKILNKSFLNFGDNSNRNIQILVDTVGKLLNADSALYNRIIENKGKKILKTIAIYQEPPGNEREDDPLGHICTDVISQNKNEVVIIKDLDKSKYGKTDPGVRKYNLKQYCGYVVRLNNKSVGSFCVVYLQNRALTETDKNIIKMLAKSTSIEEQRLNAQEQLKKSKYDLGERVKELTCLYNISKLIESTEISMEQFFTKLLTFIPPAWQFPEITCARITYEGNIFITKNFQEAQWKQIAEIKENGKKAGTLEVIYFEEMPEFDEGPFLKEERDLINAIAEHLSIFIERKRIETQIADLAKFPSENPHPVLRVTKENIIYSNKASKLLFNVREGDTIPSSLVDTVDQAFETKTSKMVEIKLINQIYSLVIAPIKETNYVNVYGMDITVRKMAERAIQKRNKEISMLLDASRAVLQYSDFEIAQKRIFNCCNNLIGADAGYVAVLNPSKKEYHKIFINPGSLTCEVDPDLPMPIRGMLAKVIKSKKVLSQNDFSNTDWINFLPKGHIPLKNVLIAPLIINNEVNGMMGLTGREGGFTDEEARIVTAFTELASISLFNSQTLESLEKSEQKYRRLNNILEQKVEERTIELKESKEKIQNLITNISDVLFEADPSGIITYISPQINNIIGYPSEELIGLNLMEFVHNEDINSFKEIAKKALKTKKAVAIDYRIKHKKGYFVPISARWSMVEINNELKVFGLVSNNTERKKIDDMIKREIKG